MWKMPSQQAQYKAVVKKVKNLRGKHQLNLQRLPYEVFDVECARRFQLII
jgi:hypothetical protein